MVSKGVLVLSPSLLGRLSSTDPRGVSVNHWPVCFLPSYKVATMSLILATSLFWSSFPRISIPLKNPTMSPTPLLWKNPPRFPQGIHYRDNTPNAFRSFVTVFNLCTQLRMQILNLKMQCLDCGIISKKSLSQVLPHDPYSHVYVHVHLCVCVRALVGVCSAYMHRCGNQR